MGIAHLKPAPSRKDNNANDAIGTVIPMTDACVGSVYDAQRCATMLLPGSGEYKISDTLGGSCLRSLSMCPYQMYLESGSAPGDCAPWNEAGGCSATGQFPQYERYQYRGDVDQCCLAPIGEKYDEEGLTCDPKYRTRESCPECSASYFGHCSKGNNMFTDGRCATWGSQNPQDAYTVTRMVCDGDPLNPYCQSWGVANVNGTSLNDWKISARKYITSDRLKTNPEARRHCKKYRGECDTGAVLNYCQIDDPNNPGERIPNPDLDDEGKKFCACANSPLKKYGTQVPVECADANCVQYGYQFSPEAPACNMTICDVYYDIVADSYGKTDLTDFVMNQNCGAPNPDECPDQTSTTDQRCPLYKAPSGEGGEGGEDGEETLAEEAKPNYTPYYIGGGVLGVLLIGGIIMLARK